MLCGKARMWDVGKNADRDSRVGTVGSGDVLRDAAVGAFQDTCLCAPPPPPRPQIRGCD